MSTFKKLFQQTFIYGLATVLPRMLNVIMIPLYTYVLPREEYGEVSIIFAYFVFFNVILAYGMETAFFRFYNKMKNSKEVLSTSGWSIVATSLVFFAAAFLVQDFIAEITNFPLRYIQIVIWILFLDALVIIPFTWLRATEKPMRFAIIKIFNICLNLGLNIFFLLFLKDLAQENSVFQSIYVPDFEISYIFISNLVASGVTLLMMLPFYFKIDFSFNSKLWKSMMSYAFPVLIAGLAFSINEVFDRLMLDYLLPKDIAREEIGAYAACYKLALFMTLFATAFRLGIEPFFFSHADAKNARETYAIITKYFVVFGSFILVAVIVFIDLLKELLIQNNSYWEAMHIVPLILLANLFLGIYHNLSVWYKITDRTRFGAYISVVGALFTLALNILLIPFISYTGSAIATLVAYGVMMLLSYFYGRKYYPIPYNLKKISGYLVLSVLFSVFSFYVFRGNYFVGISLLIIFLGTVYVSERKQFFKILQS